MLNFVFIFKISIFEASKRISECCPTEHGHCKSQQKFCVLQLQISFEESCAVKFSANTLSLERNPTCLTLCYLHFSEMTFSEFQACLKYFLIDVLPSEPTHTHHLLAGWLVWFYGISIFVGYLTPNTFSYKLPVLFQIIQFTMNKQFNCQKYFYFKLFSLAKQ